MGYICLAYISLRKCADSILSENTDWEEVKGVKEGLEKEHQSMIQSAPLSNEEVRILAERYAAGDLQARETLITAHLPLVNYLAYTYYKQGSCVSLEDLYQEGCYGLIQAVDAFDPTRGTQLSSYASFYIMKYFNEAIRNHSPVHIPENVYLLMQRYSSAKMKFYQKNGRKATVQELSEELGVSVSKLLKLNAFLYDYISLDSGITQASKNMISRDTLHDIIPSSETKRPVEVEMLSNLEELDFGNLHVRLTKREAFVLQRHLGLTKEGKPASFKEIAKDFGLSDETIRTTYHAAVKKLRSAAKEQGIDLNSFVM